MRGGTINAVNALTFTTGTPLARSLLNIGYYFTSGDDVYQSYLGFGTNYSYPASFKNDALSSQSRSVCWGCQHNAVIIVSDGDPSGDTITSTMATRLRTINSGPVVLPVHGAVRLGHDGDAGHGHATPTTHGRQRQLLPG